MSNRIRMPKQTNLECPLPEVFRGPTELFPTIAIARTREFHVWVKYTPGIDARGTLSSDKSRLFVTMQQRKTILKANGVLRGRPRLNKKISIQGHLYLWLAFEYAPTPVQKEIECVDLSIEPHDKKQRNSIVGRPNSDVRLLPSSRGHSQITTSNRIATSHSLRNVMQTPAPPVEEEEYNPVYDYMQMLSTEGESSPTPPEPEDPSPSKMEDTLRDEKVVVPPQTPAHPMTEIIPPTEDILSYLDRSVSPIDLAQHGRWTSYLEHFYQGKSDWDESDFMQLQAITRQPFKKIEHWLQKRKSGDYTCKEPRITDTQYVILCRAYHHGGGYKIPKGERDALVKVLGVPEKKIATFSADHWKSCRCLNVPGSLMPL
ncbi:hypothetical protein PROFUN_01880 [Planoprotostelium fungivorum]|uniref:Uncharacterized protein n=1 Tax=Planoprotostelium fungivorum TaxID=1890364 RepID=A0A2P6NYY9_9EUKA|nr:hypothetical protein PROFUN_01880 [Planoprotostelium fungivorum]